MNGGPSPLDSSAWASVLTSFCTFFLVISGLAYRVRKDGLVLSRKMRSEFFAVDVILELLPVDRFVHGSSVFTIFALRGRFEWVTQASSSQSNASNGLFRQSSRSCLRLGVILGWKASERHVVCLERGTNKTERKVPLIKAAFLSSWAAPRTVISSCIHEKRLWNLQNRF